MTVWLGIDLGGTNIKAAVVETDFDSVSVVRTDSVETLADEGPTAVVQRMARLAEQWVEDEPDITGVGITVPGLFNPDTGCTTFIPNLAGDWNGEPIVQPVQEQSRRSVVMLNDARAFGLAEFRAGAAAGFRSMAGITLGTGVGGVIIAENGLHLGASGAAGEIGHQTVWPDGPLCGCGNHGCLEALACASAISERAHRHSAQEVFEAAAAGDEECRRVVSETARWIGIALANIATVFTPEVFVIGGGVAGSIDQLLPDLRAELGRRACLVDERFLEVRAAALGAFAGAVGASIWARDRAEMPAA